MGQNPHSHLDLALSDMSSKVQRKQQTQKFNHDQRARSQTLQVGDTVMYAIFLQEMAGCLVSTNGLLSFQIKLQDGQVVK